MQSCRDLITDSICSWAANFPVEWGAHTLARSTIKQCLILIQSPYSCIDVAGLFLSMLQHFNLSKILSRAQQATYSFITFPMQCVLRSVALLAKAKSQSTKQLLRVDRECSLLMIPGAVPRSARALTD